MTEAVPPLPQINLFRMCTGTTMPFVFTNLCFKNPELNGYENVRPRNIKQAHTECDSCFILEMHRFKCVCVLADCLSKLHTCLYECNKQRTAE